MATTFWNTFKKPVFSLAPMEDVTDTAFRELVLSISSPDALHVIFTEFVNVEGLNHPIGRERVKHRLQVSDDERKLLNDRGTKLIAQIWGKDLNAYKEAIKFIEGEYDFDGIDINMGCPVENVVKNGCCSALIQTPDLAQKIIETCKNEATLPVSVKTRIGFNDVVTESWTRKVLEMEPAAFTIHGRIQKQMSDGEADWDEIRKSVDVRDEMKLDTPVFGNGDVKSLEQAYRYCDEYKVDGVMVGRGIFQNPWMFNADTAPQTPEDKLRLLWKHAELFRAHWGDGKNYNTLRRFFKIYVTGFSGAAKLRGELMASRDLTQAAGIINKSGIINVKL